jgi:hypothetical protein
MNKTASFLVPEATFKKLSKRLKKLAKIANIGWTVIPGTTTLRVDIQKGDSAAYLKCSRLTIDEFPKLNGWTFIARLEHTAVGTIISRVAGEELPTEYRTAKGICEHCKTKRGRKDTFVIQSPEGRLVQVGRNCLADFLCVDASQMIAMAEFVKSVACDDLGLDGDFRSCSGSCSVSTERFLACAIASIRENGFIRSGSEKPTKYDAEWLSYKPFDRSVLAKWEARQPTEKDFAHAKEIIAWEISGSSEYEHNLRIALKCEDADTRRQGILASAPSAYARAMGKLEEQKKSSAKSGGHWGVVKTRSSVNVTLKKLSFVENEWGCKTICTFETDDNELITWFATSTAPLTSDIGKRFHLRGTIKAHGQYNNRPQTIVSRCSLTEIQNALAKSA